MKTKIVCTLGPATDDYSVLKRMAENGMSVARLNFSHDTYENHKKRIDQVKKLRAESGLPIALMLDTKGPEIRVKKFKDGKAKLVTGGEFILDCSGKEGEGDDNRAFITYPKLIKHVKKGDTILLSDGIIELSVISALKTDILCKVIEGGELYNNKSINLPSVPIDMPYLSEPDRRDILFGIEQGVDFIAASFIRSAHDIKILKNLLDSNGGDEIEIIAKIENRRGVNNIDEIINECSGIMVARGDMGVEIPFELLPAIQKDIIKRCNKKGKLSITATQMLESMISKPRPTRAEILDVANAVLDGSSATMLSGETAMGKFPVESVKTMAKIAAEMEGSESYKIKVEQAISDEIDEAVGEAVCHAAVTAARELRCGAIAAITFSGSTAHKIARYRPAMPCVALTANEKTFHKLAAEFGVIPIRAPMIENSDDLFLHAKNVVLGMKLVDECDLIVIVAGIPVGEGGKTNLIKIQDAK